MEIKLADVLSREIKRRGCSVTSLGKASGVPSSTLHDWISNNKSPGARNLHLVKSLSEYLGLTLEELLFDQSAGSTSKTLFSSEFVDGERRYRLIIEKIQE